MPGFEVIGKEELESIEQLFLKGEGNLYRYGPRNYMVREFEESFARWMGVRYACAVSSGTAAIHCALAAMGIGPGDEVITTSFTFVAPVEAILSLGAVPVPVEIDETFHLDPVAVQKAINPRTKAVVSIPMWAPPKMAELLKVCEQNQIPLIEDAAQCLGGSYKGKKLGTFGRISSFSFDMGKTITTGEGGMVFTNEEELYKKASEFSDHGHQHVRGLPRGKDPRRRPGLNYRMSELTAAVGIAQLSKLDALLKQHAETKRYIKSRIADISGIEFRQFSDEQGALGDTIIFSLPTSERASSVANILQELGFGSKILPEAFDWHFAGSWNHIFQESELRRWPKTHALLKRSVALPIFFKMDDAKKEELVGAIRKAVTQS